MKVSNSWRDIAKVLHQQARPTPEYYVLCAIASAIATLGLLMNNGTAIIGAVLIAPLMGPILGIGFSMLIERRKSAIQAGMTLCFGTLLIFGISYLVSLPFTDIGITEEMSSRTKPTLLNLLIVFPAGFLAGYTRIRKSLSDKVYGVAMSVTTLPPLCIAGIALAQSEISIFLGASLMFFSNFIGILFSSFIAFALSDLQRLQRKHANRLVFPAILMFVLSIPLTFTFMEVTESNHLKNLTLMILDSKKAVFSHMEIADIDINSLEKPTAVSVTLRSSFNSLVSENQLLHSETAIQQEIDAMQKLVIQKFGKPIQLTLHLLPAKTFHARKSRFYNE
jgi:uncharacterized hydrophobic protein (TIGR00271 family)